MYTVYSICIIAELLGEASNRGARSRNVFVCMYVCMYVYIRQLLSPRSIAQ